ncbi:MAG TPA: hypothetical protein DDX85_04765 [Nitrospiraceae bacterium]|nr:hypothetical protein [Nitrospiraceae bacterium]
MSINAELSYTIKGERRTYTGQCKNLSHSGIRFETGTLLKEGAFLEITIDTKSDKFKPMNATVEVLRIDPLENSGYTISCRIVEYK